MVRHEEQSADVEGSPPAARFRWLGLAVWLPICAILSAALAWAAVLAAGHFAPLLIFPIMLGLVLGVTLVGLARLMQVGNRPTVVLGATLACLIAVLGQHYLCYRADREVVLRQAESFRRAELKHPGLVEGTAPEPARNVFDYLRRQADAGRPLLGSYVARGPVAWTSWTADGLLMVAAALLVVLPAARQPYCSRCRSWFRTTRRGRIDADSGRRLADVLKIEFPQNVASLDYRVVSCSAGCDPTGFEICWVGESGKASSTRVWLDSERRHQVIKTLDQPSTNG